MDKPLTRPELFYCFHQLLKKWGLDAMTWANDPQDPKLPKGYRMAYPMVLSEDGKIVLGLRKPDGSIVPTPSMTLEQLDATCKAEVPEAVNVARGTTAQFEASVDLPLLED